MGILCTRDFYGLLAHCFQKFESSIGLLHICWAYFLSPNIPSAVLNSRDTDIKKTARVSNGANMFTKGVLKKKKKKKKKNRKRPKGRKKVNQEKKKKKKKKKKKVKCQ